MPRPCFPRLLVCAITLLGPAAARIEAADGASNSSQSLLSPLGGWASIADELKEVSTLLNREIPGAALPENCCCADKAEGNKCDCAKARSLEKSAAAAYKTLFYDNDFRYLCDPCYDGWHLGENLKRMRIGEHVIVDVGGEYRIRQQTEQNIRNTPAVPNALGLTGADDAFLLHRLRLYANTEIGRRVRVYAEMLDAVSQYEDFPVRGIEENRTEVQNLFADLVAWDGDCGKLTIRVGREELLYGSQRLISPLDWANTRRTFDAVKLLWRGENWDWDAFASRPLRRDFDSLDPPNLDRALYGIFSTYKGLGKDKLDLYWLAYDLDVPGYRYDTLGTRFWGEQDAWLYEIEGGYQFGQNADDTDHSAAFATLGLGRKFNCQPWKPTLWAYYDWASGSDRVNDGFHHYEPLAHRYLGLMDLFGRRNLEDANLLLTMQPHDKLKLLVWYHYFWLQNGRDVAYNVDETPFAGLGSNQATSRDLGHEIDFIATIPLSARMEVLFGYSHFFAGRFYDNPLLPYHSDADFFYTQFTLWF